jgi:outer membrane receptor protein involved in Fe transport
VKKRVMAQAVAMILSGLTISAVRADEADVPVPEKITQLKEVVVFGRGEELIGKAATASEGSVGGDDLLVRPMLKVAELLEAVPGLIAAQHSGSGKANQYFLRGFNLDHGTDFTTYIDDVPMNLRTHGHGQGYLDMNGLISETVERIDFRKGTYRADTGDFSPAGAAFMNTIDRFERPFLAAEAGQYGWQRLAGGGTSSFGNSNLTYVAQFQGYDGPWELPEKLHHESGWMKYSKPLDFATLQLSLSGYHATWQPTEQIPERVIGSSVCENEFCSLDPTAIGETLRWIATARLLGNDWRATFYGQYYDWHMLSNSTYDAQINQLDRRWIAGGRYEHKWEFGQNVNLSAGTEFRYDDIGNVGLQNTDRGQFVDWVTQHAVKEGSMSLYSEGDWKLTNALRITGGLRADFFHFDVQARQTLSNVYSGTASDSKVSPKIGAAYTLTEDVELYANWGRGFHSNDGRGVINPTVEVPGLSPSVGYEGGMRVELGSVKLTATYWWLNLDSELKFVGDSNSVEPGPATERHGYELTAFWRPIPWIAIDGVWTGSHGRYIDNPDGEFIPGSVENVGEVGIAATNAKWDLSARVRYLGAYPLIEDNSQRADPEIHVNLRAAWKPGRWNVYGEVLNVLDDHAKDIVYWYESFVAGFDTVPTEGRLSRAEEPRTIRVGVKYQF